ncbi:hypothetical protein NDA17_001480 [Ustilago hordei]|nr:hypothetical protein NDA17_001480 [Ustilago hordei]
MRQTPLSSTLLLPLLLLTIFTSLISARPSDIIFTPSKTSPLIPQAPTPNKPRRITVRHYILNVTSSDIWQACESFSSTPLINSTFPGPPLRARSGEILSVRVYNSLPHTSSMQHNLTVHFHGLSMKMHPVMDGTTMVSQWPIQPGQFFDYKIPLTAEDLGTYFYHSHVGVQAMTAYGAVIVEDPDEDKFFDPNDIKMRDKVEFVDVWGDEGLPGGSGKKSPYTWDEDRVLAVSDWWSYSSPERVAGQLKGDPFVWPGSANRLLLNGKSSPTDIKSMVEPSCNATKASLVGVSCDAAPKSCTTAKDYPKIQVDYGKRYRFRFIGATSLMYVSLGIAKPGRGGKKVEWEKMELIEADGSYLHPLEVDRVEITSGQRYSTLFRSKSAAQVAKDNTGGVYWIRAESRWRAGPSMWVKLVYPSAKGGASPPALFDSAGKELQLLPKETFGWVASQLSPLSKPGGPQWWYPNPMPKDDEVTRTVIIDTQQVKFYPSNKGVKWAENGKLFNETNPDPTDPSPFLVRTFLGDIDFPTPEQLDSPSFNPTSYASSPENATVQGLIADSQAERDAAKARHWGQGYDKNLNLYFAESNEVIDIVIVNKPSQLSSSVEIHPWHMHSHKHWSRTIQPGTFSFSRLESLYNPSSSPSPGSGFQQPIKRDTTIVYASPGAAYLNQTIPNPNENDGGFAVLRYKVDGRNAGVFLLHCHLTFHLEMGMGTVWTMAPRELADKMSGYPPKQVGVASGGEEGECARTRFELLWLRQECTNVATTAPTNNTPFNPPFPLYPNANPHA